MSTEIPAEVGDNEFWLLAKQCASLGYTPQAGDTTFTLQSRLVGLQGGGGGGGGIPEAPTDGNLYGRENAAWVEVPPSTGVQKTGDTMTGTLVMKNDQFTADTNNGTPVAAVVIEDNAGAEATGLALASFGDLTITGPRKGLQIHNPGYLQMYASDGTRTIFLDSGGGSIGFPPAAGLVMFGDTTNGDLIISANLLGNGIRLNCAGGTSALRLHLAADDSGDLIVTSISGPNAGKSVNLTAGKWA